MAPAIAYTLPGMQVVCNLVVLSNLSSPIPAVDHSLPQDESKPVPEGYVAYPGIGLAYKVYNETVTYMENRDRCTQEGAKVAVIDSMKKVEYLKSQILFTDGYLYAGIIRIDNEWVNFNTGSLVSAVPWNSGRPIAGTGNGRDCAYLYTSDEGLSDYSCSSNHYYACEVPIIPRDYMIKAN